MPLTCLRISPADKRVPYTVPMAEYRHIAHGFEPVFDERSRIVVLGSFPSVLSRANDFYYGNPRNRFWDVMAACAHDATPTTIEEKKALLLWNGVALWDVIEECDIKGSSDASIKNVVPAPIERVFAAAPIQAVFCNGGTAGRLYHKYLEYKTGLPATVLPSTSPANASWSLEALIDRWREALGVLSRASDAEARNAGAVEYALVSTGAPPASTYATHRSMQGNKGKDTKPELLVRTRLREAGLSGYRLHWKAPGKPDIAWPGKRVCLFINGCFWHRCPHCNPRVPKTNVEYWSAKFDRNVERDERNLAALAEAGWRVHVIWECELKKDRREKTFAKLLPELAQELGKELLG